MTSFGPAEAARVRDTCVCLNTRSLARLLTSRYDEALGPTGIRITQFSMLAFVRAMGPVAPGDLAGAMGLDQTTISRNIELLRRANYLTVTKAGRNRIVALTASGQSLLDAAYARWNAVQTKTIDALGGRAHWLRLNAELAAAAES